MSTTKTSILLLFVLQFQLVFIVSENLTENNSLRQQVIEDFTNFCPYTPTCINTNATSAQNPAFGDLFDQDSQQPCCDRCSCEPHCGDQCCPDKPEILYHIRDNTLSHECIYAQYRPYEIASSNGNSYQMKIDCPVHVGRSQYNVGCEKKPTDFDISDYLDIVPVTSKATGETYKNHNCAFCNHENTSDLIYWKMHFKCEWLNSSLPNTLEDIAKLARNNKMCNIRFHPVYSSKVNVAECDKLIDSCNFTGAWESYDPLTEIACMSYESRFDGTYKNVHCYLCNHGKQAVVPKMCRWQQEPYQGSAFTAILDFNKLEKTKEGKASLQSCPFQHVFDKYKNTCRRLWCSDGLSFKDSMCVPLFEYFYGGQTNTSIVYAITFAIQPQQNNSTKKYVDPDSMKIEMIDNIIQRADRMGLSTIQFSSFIRLRKSITDLRDELQQGNRSLLASDIEYIAIEIKFGENFVNNVSERLEKITETLLNLNSSEFVAYHLNITRKQFRNTSSACWKISSEHNETTSLSSTVISNWLKEGLSCGYDEGGRGIIPFPTTETNEIDTVFALINEPFCPRLVLKVDDFSVSFDKYFVYLTDIGGMFSRSDLSFSENGDYISVCHSLYLSLVENYYTDEQSTNYAPMTILTIFCTSLSLISLVITLTTYCILRALRTVPGLNNMGLVISLILFMSLTLVNACVDVVEVWLCRVIGVTLHLSLLSAFGWMFICSFHMTKVFAHILERTTEGNILRTLFSYVSLVELLSISVVLFTIVVSHVTSDGESIGYTDKPCYVDQAILLYNVAIPVVVVVVANFAMYLYVIITISRIPDIRKDSSHERNNVIIFVKLSTITGMTWIFGFVYQFTNVEVFAYIFTVLNASQGMFIMFSFVVNKRVYEMCRPKSKQSGSMTTSTKTSASTDM